MKLFFEKVNKSNKGFTLVETLVAISIFTVSILGLMSVLTQSIANITYAKEKLTASYLAQEGIEYIRNMRDTFVLYDAKDSQTGWNNFNTKIVPLANTLCASANGCYFDDQKTDYTNHLQSAYINNLMITACASSCPNLLYDSATGKYGYLMTGSTVNSGLTRQIKVTQISADEIQILSAVYWKQGSGSYNVSFSEHLFNWIQ